MIVDQPAPSEQPRRWSRHKVDVRLKVSWVEAGSRTSTFGRGQILSHGGLGAYIPTNIPVGGTVMLEVNFPSAPVDVKVQAVVKSCQGFRYGLEFVDVPPEVRSVITKNCEAAASEV
jgi:hypothetical protein